MSAKLYFAALLTLLLLITRVLSAGALPSSYGQTSLETSEQVQGICTVSIRDDSAYKPVPVTTKNVGQEIEFFAVLSQVPEPIFFSWSVEGEVIDDYFAADPAPFTVLDREETAGDPPVAQFTEQSIRFFWREQGIDLTNPVTRTVQVIVTAGANISCMDNKTFTVERRKEHNRRKPEDYYTRNHDSLVLLEQKNWHDTNPCPQPGADPASKPDCPAGFAGSDFFEYHRRFLERYEAWRFEFGYPTPILAYTAAGSIPATEAGYTLADPTRLTNNPNNLIPAWYSDRPTLVKAPWLTIDSTAPARPAGDMACEPAGGQINLYFYSTYDMAGCAVQGWRNAFHQAVGGNMDSSLLAPQDPVFWRWIKHLDSVGQDWLATRAGSGETPPVLAAVFPARDLQISSTYNLNLIRVTFDQQVVSVDAGNLFVNGSAAANYSVSGNTYTFTGFAPPGVGNVLVNLAAGNIANQQALPFAGDNWQYQVVTCVDADNDGVYEGACWPEPSFDNCPTVYNPDQLDSNNNGVGDACELSLFHLYLPLIGRAP
jgi:hypothetical protein